MQNEKQSTINILEKCSNKKEPKNYDYQDDIINVLCKMNKKEKFSTIVSVPTGGGKTKIASDFCRKMLQTDGNKVLWLSDSIDLLIQSIERFHNMNISRDIKYQLVCSTTVYDDLSREKTSKSIDTINRQVKEISNDADIIFASVDTMIHADKEFLKAWFANVQENGKIYIIYDEVHHIGAKETDKFFDWLLRVGEQETPILHKFGLVGLTATVYRHDSPIRSFNKWFKNGYDKKIGIISMDTPYGEGSGEFVNNRIEIVSIEKLIQKKILMKPQIIRVDDFESGIPENRMDYLVKKISNNYKKKNWNKTIIFVDTIKNAVELQTKLNETVPCFVYTSQTVEEVGNDLSDFKKTDGTSAKVMIAVDMVSEGFDVRDIETIYLFSKIQSHILLRQRVGRVLRTAKNKNKATVYWQKYFNHTKNSRGLYNYSYDKDIFEDDVEIQKEIELHKKGMQLPAGMYLSKIPIEFETERKLYEEYEYLHVLDLFGLDITLEGIGYYELTNTKIYARQRERNGYEQFHRIIRSDYFSLLMYKDKYSTFQDYAKALGVSEEALLEDIKINCFYMSNASVKDTKGQVQKKSFRVNDEDIKSFYEYVITNDLQMPFFHVVSGSEDDAEKNEKESHSKGNTSISRDALGIGEYMKDYKLTKSDNLLDGIKLHQKYVHYKKNKAEKEDEAGEKNKDKVYPDMLTYGKSGVTYYEMLSVRTLMGVGAVANKRECGNLFGVEGEFALIGKSKENKYYVRSVLSRSTKDIYDNDLLLYAQALVTVPNHIDIKVKENEEDDGQDDVQEYENCLKASILQSAVSENTDWNKLIREYIMALGLKDNDDIIRVQCELFSGKLPRLLQYVIYCKAYGKLAEKVNFVNAENIVSPSCLNENELKQLYREILDDFGIEKLDDDLMPVEDVIYDYRPYLKVIPYYQGIKPEFLCRMLNEMLRLGNKQNYKFIDAFGGSGTVGMNIDNRLSLEQTYNDLGILNNALFEVIKSDGGKGLKDRVAEFIDLVINFTGDEDKAKAFLQPYDKFIKEYNIYKSREKEIDLADIEKEYEKIYKGRRETHNKEHISQWKDLDARVNERAREYSKILQETCNQVDVDRLYEIQKFLHALTLVNWHLFHHMSDKENIDLEKVDLAFIFLLYHSLSGRHFYNDATIDKFAKFIGTYEEMIDNCAEIFKNVEVLRGRAEDLLESRKELSDCVWYHDIPYSETNTSTYSSDWFDEANFVEKLGSCKGDYIVASRFNICEQREGGLDLVASKEVEKDDATRNKEKNIIKFFGRFVSKTFSDKYEDLVIEEFPREDTDCLNCEEQNDKKQVNPWTHIADNKVAKYVCFSFSQTEVIKSEKKNKKIEYVKNYTNISKEAIRRMLKNAQISDIEVEVMITNMDLSLEKMPVKLLDESDGIWYLPSFKTKSSYKIEPVTIIMKYERFMMDMVLYLLDEKAYFKSDARETAAAFRAYFENRVC